MKRIVAILLALIVVGAAQSIYFWVPADAGYLTGMAAYKTLKCELIVDGIDMGATGYHKITVQKNEHGIPVIYGQEWVDVNKDNLDDWKDVSGKYKL